MANNEVPKWTGSIVLEPYTEWFKAYNVETRVLANLGYRELRERLLKTRKFLTQALREQPTDTEKWLARAAVHLQMQFPELAAGDAFKAWILLREAEETQDGLMRRSNAALLYCQSLFYTQSFTHGLLKIQSLHEESDSGLVPLDADCLARLRRLRSYIYRCLEGLYQCPPYDPRSPLRLPDAKEISHGKIRAGGYPWIKQEHRKRDERTRVGIGEVLSLLSDDTVAMGISNTGEEQCFGLFATDELRKGDTLLKEKPAIAAADFVTRECCGFCCVVLEWPPTSFASIQGYCSRDCMKRFAARFGSVIDFGKEADMMEHVVKTTKDDDDPEYGNPQFLAEEHLRYRIMASIVHQMEQAPNSDLHPLDTVPIALLAGYESAPKRIDFSIWRDVELPLVTLEMLDIDIFGDMRFDTWVLLTIDGRVDMNAWEDDQELENGSEVTVTGLNTMYSLLNHSCDPNVDWFRDDITGEIVVKTMRDIEAGEELFVSYITNALLKRPTAERLQKLQNWMGDEPHHCPRCYPEHGLEVK